MPRVQPGSDITYSPRVAEGSRPHRSDGPQFGTSLKLAQGRGRLVDLLQQIDQAGASLANRRTVYELKTYRELVGAFLKEVQAQAYTLQRDMEWDHHTWEQRTLVTVRTVNDELDQLAQQVLSREEDNLAILARVGEIKGLLLDLQF